MAAGEFLAMLIENCYFAFIFKSDFALPITKGLNV
uniref:Uncharacterized protein n=1 Tax=Anguilla anguilla TaxID=7936 RepID=A0A0E9VWT8_ANGAN